VCTAFHWWRRNFACEEGWMRKILLDPLNLDWKIAILTIFSTLLLIVDHYHYPIFPWTEWLPNWENTNISVKVVDRTFLYFIVPMLCILVIFKENPVNYGFGLGDWKKGILFSLAGILIMTPILWFIGKRDPIMGNYYDSFLPGLPWNTLLDLFGWEFMFRGFLLFGYAKKFGAEAIWIQAVPFALAHIGKPEVETLSTIFGGFVFGWVAWRTRSFLYPLIIHWYIASFIIIVAAKYSG